jgi:hypothetical protein
MTSAYIDHAVEARSRVAMQYTESARFLATLSALAGKCQELEDVLLSLKEVSDIDLAQGVQLDVIGDIVGITRYIPNAVLLPFFGFDDTAGGYVFGEEDNPAVGARFRDEDEPYLATSVLGDPEYRLMIRAKIIKNHAIGTNEDILAGMAYIFQGALNVVEDNGGMSIRIAVGRNLSLVEQTLVRQLDLLPRPNGVQITSMVSFQADQFFGFDDQTGALGFDDASPVGGIFAEEF